MNQNHFSFSLSKMPICGYRFIKKNMVIMFLKVCLYVLGYPVKYIISIKFIYYNLEKSYNFQLFQITFYVILSKLNTKDKWSNQNIFLFTHTFYNDIFTFCKRITLYLYNQPFYFIMLHRRSKYYVINTAIIQYIFTFKFQYIDISYANKSTIWLAT